MPPRKKTEAPETEQVETAETETGSSPVDVPDKATPIKPADPVPVPQIFGATFAERAAARAAAEGKQVTSHGAENKAVQK